MKNSQWGNVRKVHKSSRYSGSSVSRVALTKMRPRRDKILLILKYIFVVSIGASKCPESRKPHVTSCTIFYNCINLPEGGYVWAPAKCAEGLVFQPYLRICVLPGDTWTCDNLSTEKSVLTDNYERQELINSAETSYLSNHQSSTSSTDHPSIDPSYAIDASSEFANQRPLVTPYPLIEIHNTKEKNMQIKETNNNVAISQVIEHKVENYLHSFFTNQQRLQTKFGNLENNGGDNNFPWLRGIIDRMLLYENIAEFTSGTSCQSSSHDNLKKNDFHNNVKKEMLDYLVQGYILRRSLMGKLKKKSKRKSTTTESNEQIEDEFVSIGTTVVDNPVDSLIDGPKSENNIVVIQGNLGGKEYITVSKYKSLSSKVKLEVYEILPCAKGIRLPNRTDCTKYYTCDPDSATIVEFSCTTRTAFNDYNRICEFQKYKNCVRELNAEETTTIFFQDEATLIPHETEIPVRDEPCQNTGKYVDSMSEKHYYVCFSSQLNPTKIESLRMICPNDLIFCQERRVCTTKKRCYEN